MKGIRVQDHKLKAILRTFKQLLTYLGAILPESVLYSLQMVLNYMKLGRWNRSQGFVICRISASRPGL